MSEFRLKTSAQNTCISLQWKGTDACMDFNCECGHHSHIDSFFCYYIKCPNCNAVYELNSVIEAKKVCEKELKCSPICSKDIENTQNFYNAIKNGAKVDVSVQQDKNDPKTFNIDMIATPQNQPINTEEEMEKVRKTIDDVAKIIREKLSNTIGE